MISPAGANCKPLQPTEERINLTTLKTVAVDPQHAPPETELPLPEKETNTSPLPPVLGFKYECHVISVIAHKSFYFWLVQDGLFRMWSTDWLMSHTSVCQAS